MGGLFPLVNREKYVLLGTHAFDLTLLQVPSLKAFVLCFSFTTSVSGFFYLL